MTLIMGIADGQGGYLIGDTLLWRTDYIEKVDPGLFDGSHHALKIE